MKIGEAMDKYRSNRALLIEQKRGLASQKKAAELKFKETGDSMFSENAATLELSLNATEEIFKKNQEVLDRIAEQQVAYANLETTKQQNDAMSEEAQNMGKIMAVFRRLAAGDRVPSSDEKKLMEYDHKMYQVAKNMQAMAQQMKKKHKDYDSLWEDEEKKENPDPMEVADNMEYEGELPNFDIPVEGSEDVTGE